jgi:hypothetical protein
MIEIPVSKGKYVALIDDEDFELVSQYKWRAYRGGDPGKNGTVYAIAHEPMVNGKDRGSVIMHRLIMKAPKGLKIDHWDGEGLNNQKYNLRLATNQQNAHNRKLGGKFKGVSLDKRHGTWKAYIVFDRKNIWLGQHKTEESAARAYDMAARRLFGEFAKCNFNQIRED